MKMTVITDNNGKLLGSVKLGTIQHGKHLMQVRAVPRPGQVHHDIDIDDNEMRRPVTEVQDLLTRKVAGSKR